VREKVSNHVRPHRLLQSQRRAAPAAR
jgi:hypothetical protein